MENKNYKNGLIYALSCAVIWGFLPIYWNSLKPVSSLVVIFYRITLMTLTCFAVQLYQTRNLKAIFAPMFADRKKIGTYVIAGILITANWSIYIWAVQAGYVIQASMGYFLEPLLVCLLGMILFKEKANKWKRVSLGFAVAGMMVMVIGYRELPLIAIEDLPVLAKEDPLYASLAEIVARNGGLWCSEAEAYLLANAPKA